MEKVLILYAHPDDGSFNHAVLETAEAAVRAGGHECTVLDLYRENYNPVMTAAEVKGEVSEESKRYQHLVKEATALIFIFPVWWFRAPAILEGFLDKVFTPKFAYRFKPLIGKMGVPLPLLGDKTVTTFMTHGAPALPVKTLYVNAVKYRFLLGFLSFCFNVFRCRIIQFWSVPQSSDQTRKGYLERVTKIIHRRIKPVNG